ncbi:MAG: ATP-binding protein [Pseudomonadota bacterium]
MAEQPLTDKLQSLVAQAVQRALLLLPEQEQVDWAVQTAVRWQRSRQLGQFHAHSQVDPVRLADLLHIDDQKAQLAANTRQLLQGLPANNALLWGARGTGKSSLVHALLNEYAQQGLRLVEIGREDLADLGEVIERLTALPYAFIVFCDDLSFEADDPSYKALKSALEGSIFRTAGNVVIYATSNRRHLVPEHMSDNQQSHLVDGELHHGEAVEEKISLSDRFGVWLSFYPLRQDAYLEVVAHWVTQLAAAYQVDVDLADGNLRMQALQWALARGTRNGRTAQYFARDWVGQLGLQKQQP